MNAERPVPERIDAYIAGFPEDVREVLQAIRATIHQAVPQAEEAISYKIPAFRLQGTYLLYFAGFKKHVSLYPAPIEHAAFRDELAPYASGRGTARFPLDEPLPLDLIGRIAAFSAGESQARAAARGKKKQRPAREGGAAGHGV